MGSKASTQPPLSAADALGNAKTFVAEIKPERNHFWQLQELSLADVHGWLWKARFQLEYKGGSTGPPYYMDCYILMDGTVVKPIVTREQKNKKMQGD